MTLSRASALATHSGPSGFGWLAAVASLLVTVGCDWQADSIKINGSSTVYPISEAIAEEYRQERPDVRVTVGHSGTGGGLKMLAAGEIDICDASRRVTPSELEELEGAGIGCTEFIIALDGIAVVVHRDNDWVDSLTVDQLASIWRPDRPVTKWSELNPDWPDKRIKLYGPGSDSGTFEYFTEKIVGKARSCRSDFAASEDDNFLVTGVSEDRHSLGYFGLAYYAENTDKLKLLGVAQADAAPVKPTAETIGAKTYAPLTRPLFIYVRDDLLASADGAPFVEYYLKNAGAMAAEVGYVPVSDEIAASNTAKYHESLQTTSGRQEKPPVAAASLSIR